MLELAAIPSISQNVIMISHKMTPGSGFTQITHGDLHIKSAHIAVRLMSYGVKKGDRVMVCLRSTNLPLGMFACMLIGAIPIWMQFKIHL